MPADDLLIINAVVMTVNPAFEVFNPGLVGVRDGRITRVGPFKAAMALPAAARLLDAAGGIVMPGLVNAHTHLPMTLFRGLADDLPLKAWLEEHIFPAEARHIRPETVRIGSRLACAEMALGGTTCCCDGYFHADQVAEAVSALGLRGVIGQGVIDFPAPGVPDPAGNVAAARDFVVRWQGVEPRITPSIFCHSPYACGRDTLQGAKAAARALGCLFQIHVAETENERRRSLDTHGFTPVAWLDDLGVLDRSTLAVHAVWADEADIAILVRRAVAVAYNPQSNMQLASGIAPVSAMLAAGVTVGLGTDGCASNNDMDLFAEMDSAAKLQKIARGRPTALTARDVIRMATIDGAAAIGLADTIGSLVPGKAADLIVLAAERPHLVPMYQPASTVVYAARGSDVRHVFVGGQAVVHDGRLQTADLSDILADARRVAANIATERK